MDTLKYLLIALVALATACTSSGNQNTKPENPRTIEAEPAATEAAANEIITQDTVTDALALLQDSLAENGYACAVAYIGTILDGKSTEKEHIAASDYITEYPFMAEIGDDRTLRNDGNEVYCIIPAKGYNSLNVSTFIINESNNYKGAADKELYTANDGKPILVRGNVSEIMPNIIVTLSDGDNSVSFNPSLSMRDGRLNRYGNEKNISDITRYDPNMVFGE